MKRIDWYILRELGGPFFFGVTAFSSIFIGSSLLMKIAGYMIDMDMPLHLAAKIFVLELPAIVVLTFPMSMLLAALLAFGRLSGNSEIIAFKAGGVSFWRMVIPVICVGILTSVLTIYINEEIVPFSSYQTRKTVWEFTHKGSKMPVSQKHLSLTPIDSKTGTLDYILYAERFDGETQTLSNVVYSDYENGTLSYYIEARQAKWHANQWVFLDGTSYVFSGNRQPVTTMEFGEYEMKTLDRTPSQLAMGSKILDEMSAAELREFIELNRKEGRKMNKHLVKYHQHFAIPLSCLIFALVGAPLGLQPNRSGSSIGLGISMVVIFIYYVVLTAAGAVGQSGAIPPFLGAWLPNILFTLIGIGFNVKAAR